MFETSLRGEGRRAAMIHEEIVIFVPWADEVERIQCD